MNCSKYVELISATLDGEATPEERSRVEQHTAQCAQCRRLLHGQRALKHAISRLDGRASPPEAVHARVEALRFRWPSKRRRLRGVAYASLAVVGTALALLAGRGLPGGARRSLPDELIADHLKYMPEDMPAEVASDDPSEVRRFFEGKLGFEPVVPRLEGSRLIGGRACRIEGQMVQLLFYERGREKLSLYVSDGSMNLDGCRGRDGHYVCGHRRGRLSLMLVGDAPDAELRTLLGSAVL
jgi:anti-sigma factor RsiW